MWPVTGSARPCVSRQAALSMSVWFFFSPSFHEHIFSLSSSLSVKSHMLSTHIVTIWSSNICQDTESLPSIKDLPPSHSQSFSLSTWHKLLVVLSSRAPYLVLSLTSLWPSHTCLLVPLITFFLRLFPLSLTLALQFFNLLLPCHLSSLLLFSFP